MFVEWDYRETRNPVFGSLGKPNGGIGAGCSYAGFFGCNLNDPSAMSLNTFHVNCLNACDTPLLGAFPFVSGAIFKYDSTLPFPLPLGALPLYIMP